MSGVKKIRRNEALWQLRKIDLIITSIKLFKPQMGRHQVHYRELSRTANFSRCLKRSLGKSAKITAGDEICILYAFNVHAGLPVTVYQGFDPGT